MKIILTIVLAFIFNTNFNFAQLSNQTDKYVEVKDLLVKEKLKKWQDLKFGLLITWGPYSQWGIVESWSLCPEDYNWCKRGNQTSSVNYFEYKKDYENLQSTFNPTEFNSDKWAKAAKNAGMKYVIAMSKHHDGFCMFDTKTTNYKITDNSCPFSKNSRSNILKEILCSFSKEQFMTGIYFSKPDWHSEYYWDPYFPPFDRNVNYDPELYPEKWNKFVKFTHKQIMELMTDYGNVDILWLDGGWVAKRTPSEINNYYFNNSSIAKSGFIKSKFINQDINIDDLVPKIREKQPGLIIVDRAVEGKNQNYLTPENTIPERTLPYPWESCITSGNGWSWSEDTKYKSSYKLVHMLIDIVCKGGNLLLNIAPGPDGNWDNEAYKRLEDIGNWMRVNSEAIYNTKAIYPYKESSICYTNKKETNTVYAIYLRKENDKRIPSNIIIKSFTPKSGTKISLLGNNIPLKWNKIKNGTKIIIPKDIQNNPTSKYALAFKINEIENHGKNFLLNR